jgi:hypothetical protein
MDQLVGSFRYYNESFLKTWIHNLNYIQTIKAMICNLWLLEAFCRHHCIFAVLNTIRCEGAFLELGSFLLACMQCTASSCKYIVQGATYLFSCINYLWGCMFSHRIGCVKFLFLKLFITIFDPG